MFSPTLGLAPITGTFEVEDEVEEKLGRELVVVGTEAGAVS